MGSPTDLHTLASEWLAVLDAAVATTPGGAIDRGFVSPGVPALDCCPQLTVHVGGPQQADTSPVSPPLTAAMRTGRSVGAVHLISLTATVARCVPGIHEDDSLPSIVEMEASALKTTSDLWAIWNWTLRRHADGSLFPSPSGSREMFLDPAFPLANEGGCGGWEVPIRVALGGYDA